MKQKIILCRNTNKLADLLINAGHFTIEYDDKGNEIKIGCLPVDVQGQSIDKNNQRLTCVLLNTTQEKQINEIEGMMILGTYEEIFASPDKLKIYDNIYDRSKQTLTDQETGEIHTYTPPDYFSEIAIPDPDPDPDEIKKQKKAQRDKMLADSVQIVQTHNEQKDLGVPTDISDEQYKQTLQFRESLRKM